MTSRLVQVAGSAANIEHLCVLRPNGAYGLTGSPGQPILPEPPVNHQSRGPARRSALDAACPAQTRRRGGAGAGRGRCVSALSCGKACTTPVAWNSYNGRAPTADADATSPRISAATTASGSPTPPSTSTAEGE